MFLNDFLTIFRLFILKILSGVVQKLSFYCMSTLFSLYILGVISEKNIHVSKTKLLNFMTSGLKHLTIQNILC